MISNWSNSIRRRAGAAQVAERRATSSQMAANKELLRKHFLLELNGKTGAGVYVWPSVEAAEAHNEDGAIGDQAYRHAPTIRYFDLFCWSTTSGKVTEFPAAAELEPPDCNAMLWAVFTLIAAAAQTARNAMQRELTATLGTVGATHVRFLFGFPFALILLAGVMLATGEGLPHTAARILAVGDRRRLHADRRHRDYAAGDGRALVRGRLRLHQDRAGAGRAVRPDLPRRPGHAARRRRHPDRHRRRDRDLAQARRRRRRHHALDR